MLSSTQTCPGCDRPRIEGRASCIYCGESFVAPGRQVEALFDDLLPLRERELPGTTVVIEQRESDQLLDPEVVAPMLGLSEFQAQQLLRRRGAVHLVFDDARAEVIAETARANQLPVTSFRRAELDALPEPDRVLRLELPAQAEAQHVRYREEHDPDVMRVATTRRDVRVRLDELVLVVAGRIDIELERQVSMGSMLKANADDPLDRLSSRPRVRDYDGRLVFDLWTRSGQVFRLLELQSTISGDGFVEARRGAAFGSLRRWLEHRCPQIAVADGFARQATARRRRLDRVSAGIPWSPSSKSGVVTQQVRDTGGAWDAWSASCFVLWRRQQSPG